MNRAREDNDQLCEIPGGRCAAQVVQERVHASGQLGGAFGFPRCDALERQRGQRWVVGDESHGLTLRTTGLLSVTSPGTADSRRIS